MAYERGKELLAAHRRVRQAIQRRGMKETIEPQRPALYLGSLCVSASGLRCEPDGPEGATVNSPGRQPRDLRGRDNEASSEPWKGDRKHHRRATVRLRS